LYFFVQYTPGPGILVFLDETKMDLVINIVYCVWFWTSYKVELINEKNLTNAELRAIWD